MLGGESFAKQIQSRLVHTLGNLTLTGYNSNLGNRSFAYKRDRKESNSGSPIGYRNGFSLNDDVVGAPDWTAARIEARTERLVRELMERFSLGVPV